MTRERNYSGYVKYDSENELKEHLEKKFFPYFFDRPWESIRGETKEVVPIKNSSNRIDYYGTKKKVSTYIEVKNWWITKKDIRQIYNYNSILKGEYNFYIICGGVETRRKKFLEDLGIKIILIKDIKLIAQGEVAEWM